MGVAEEESCSQEGEKNDVCALNGSDNHQLNAASGTSTVGEVGCRTLVFFSPLLNLVNAAVLIAMTAMIEIFPTHRRGFFCDDLSIRYPHLPETISTKTVIAASYAFSLSVFAVCEYLRRRDGGSFGKATFGSKKVIVWVRQAHRCNVWYLRVLKLMFVFLWGTAFTHVLCYVLKSSLGVLRPHFFAACNPNVTCEAGDTTYHEDYVCRSLTESQEVRARQAFPSGHATLAGFAAVFLVFYAQFALRPKFGGGPFIVRPMFQAVVFAVSCWLCTTRVMDHVHHLQDVVAGYLLGAAVGVVLGYQAVGWLSDLHAASRRNDASETADPNVASCQEAMNLNGVDREDAEKRTFQGEA